MLLYKIFVNGNGMRKMGEIEMKNRTELIFKCFIIILFILTIILGVLAFVVLPRNMLLFFIAMVCALCGNILNLVRLLLKRKNSDK